MTPIKERVATIIGETMHTHEPVAIARLVLDALREPTDDQIEAFMNATVWRDGDVTSHVFDFMSEGDNSDRNLMGLPPSSGTALLANDEMREFYQVVIRAGLCAALNCQR